MLSDKLQPASTDLPEGRRVERGRDSVSDGVWEKTVWGGHVPRDLAPRERYFKYHEYRISRQTGGFGRV